MIEIPTFAPETDLVAVANHDFNGLSMPILVACYDRAQLEEFVFREGLMCSEVRRLDAKTAQLDFPEEKILILLPAWEEHRATKDLVDRWIFVKDRYTVTLRTPRPLINRRPRFTLPLMIAASVTLWGVIGWLIFR